MSRPSILGCAVLSGLLSLLACKLPPAEGPEVAEQDEPDVKAVAAIPVTEVKQNTGAPRAQLVGTEGTTTAPTAPAETEEQKAARQAAEKLAKAKTGAANTLLDEAAKLKTLGDAGLATAADKMMALAKEISPEAVTAYEAAEKAKADKQRMKEAEKTKPATTTTPAP